MMRKGLLLLLLLFNLCKFLNKTGLCFYPARNTRHMYCIVSWGFSWGKEGQGQGDLVSQPDLS